MFFEFRDNLAYLGERTESRSLGFYFAKDIFCRRRSITINGFYYGFQIFLSRFSPVNFIPFCHTLRAYQLLQTGKYLILCL